MTVVPVQVKIRRALVVGSGDMARNKHRLLSELGAEILWWQEPPSEQKLAEESAKQQRIETRLSLVVIADFGEFGNAMAQWARDERLLCNLVDRPEQSDAYIPAIVSRGSVRIGIGTGGDNPVLARLVRTRIEQILPIGLEHLGSFTKKWREKVALTLPDMTKRRRFWEKTLSGNIAELVMSHGADHETANTQLTAQLNKARESGQENSQQSGAEFGSVVLVGAGPGDPSLLTLRGLRALQQADVVLYDNLVSPEVVKLARRDAWLECVGKHRGAFQTPQDDICQRMIDLARRGKHVCRLKGGDPYVFARGGEEAYALATAGIKFEVVAGITSANAIAAVTGIPLTHRGYARTVRFLTGHLALGQDATSWQALATRQETLVVYMGLGHAVTIAQELIACGVPQDLPVALVQNGTLEKQKIVTSCLVDMKQGQQQFKLDDGPVLLIIGEVVKLRKAIFHPEQCVDQQSPVWQQVNALETKTSTPASMASDTKN